MKVYKVVRIVDYRLYSVFRHQYMLEYEVNKWTIPRIGRILAFEDLDCAIRFARVTQDIYVHPDHVVEIYEAEAWNVIEIKYLPFVYNAHQFENFWATGEAELGSASSRTVGCMAIRLLKHAGIWRL